MWLVTLTTALTAIGANEADAARSPDPVADPKAVVVCGDARFTVLTSALVRLEWSPGGRFEDRASFAFINRRLPVPEFRTTREDGWLTLTTADLTLRYRENSGRFDRDNLSIELTVAFRPVVVTPATEDRGNLRGTTRTLDGVSGACPLEPGLLSRDGWVWIDDSQRLLFDDSGWARPRPRRRAQDWYFFGHGRDYKRALRDFVAVAGRVPLPPRFVFGAWWSRYWAYSDAELRDLVGQFRAHDVPLDVLVVDMDWHLDGWTGYTWNPKYFPDPDAFLKWARDQGLRITLNLHPADGVHKHEARFAEMAAAMGVDPAATDPIPFDCTDPRYMNAYFTVLHHPLQRQGVDFWWIDWQQGTTSKLPGLDPLFWLNHLHWTDMRQNPITPGRRPLIFSRWGGLGNHRYPIGFSGDTYCNWPSLAFQPYFTATAGNVAYAWWSHDIGGHQPGPVEPELYARWIQFGALSPILRTHTTKSPAAERRIWAFPEEVFDAAREAFHLRYALVPYFYTTARQCYDTGLPLCRPLYYEWPDLEEAYHRPGQYLLGDQLLIAPVTEPANPVSGCAEVFVWFPPGEWTHWFTGRTYAGPSEHALLVPLNEIPQFVRSGGIVPAMTKMHRTNERPVDPLILHLFPGEAGETRIYEDDGETVDYQVGRFAWTPVSHHIADGVRYVTIGPVEGSYPGMPRQRGYEIHLRDVWPADRVVVDGQPLESVAPGSARPGWHYDAESCSVVIRLPPAPLSRRIELAVHFSPEHRDTALLRGGWRGQQNDLARVAGLLGDHSPTVLRDALDTWRAIATRPTEALKSAAAIQDDWLDLLRAVQDCGAAEDARRRALVQLLGLFSRVRVAAGDSGNGDLTATIDIAVTHAIWGLSGLTGRARLTSSAPWRIAGSSTWDIRDLSSHRPFRAAARLASDDGPHTGTLRSELTITADGLSLDLASDTAFLPSINDWWIVGPFDCPFAEGLKRKFPPEASIDLKATYVGKEGAKIGWRRATRPLGPDADLTADYFVHFHKFFGRRNDDAVAYALAYLDAPHATDAVLAIGSDDGVVVWLNGREVHRHETGRPFSPRQDRVRVALQAGPNVLLLKINQGGGDWGFSVHVESPDGRPLPGLRVRPTS